MSSSHLALQVGKLSKSERQKRAPGADDQGSENSDGAEGNGDANSSESENEDAADDDDLTVRCVRYEAWRASVADMRCAQESGTSESSGEDE